MRTDNPIEPSWSTSAHGAMSDSLPMELGALGKELGKCHAARSRAIALRCMAETVGRFAASHFVTTLVLAVTLMLVLSALP